MHIDELRGESLGTAISKTLVQKPRIEDCFFWCLCVCLSSSDNAGGYSFWLSALVFAHLCSCSHKHRWNTVSWQHGPDCVYRNCWGPLVGWSTITLQGLLRALVRRYGNSLFLLKELLGHGLANRTLTMNTWLFLLVLCVCLSSSNHAGVELVDPQLCCL